MTQEKHLLPRSVAEKLIRLSFVHEIVLLVVNMQILRATSPEITLAGVKAPARVYVKTPLTALASAKTCVLNAVRKFIPYFGLLL